MAKFQSKPVPSLTTKEIATFWSKVRKEPNGCWMRITNMRRNHYPMVYLSADGKNHTAHRISYSLKTGRSLEGICVLHSCDNRRCCNPDHLFEGTIRDNAEDASKKARMAKKLCPSQVLEIRSLREAGLTLVAIGKMYSVDHKTVFSIVNRRSWRFVEG